MNFCKKKIKNFFYEKKLKIEFFCKKCKIPFNHPIKTTQIEWKKEEEKHFFLFKTEERWQSGWE